MGDADYKVPIDGKDWTATELSALILKKLRQDCSAQVGEIRDAVISVPAHFDEIRRKATMDAGTAAGFNVIGIVNEPVAAALCYTTSREVSGRVLVYDLGGGTFDVTLMDVKGLEMEILCSQGDHALGGIDFDKAVLEILQKLYQDKFSAELIGSEEDRAKYEDEAEDIKKTLSRRPVAKTMLYGPSGSMRAEISRQMFEEAITSLVVAGRHAGGGGPGRGGAQALGHRHRPAGRRQLARARWCGRTWKRSSAFRRSARSTWMSAWRWAPLCTPASP